MNEALEISAVGLRTQQEALDVIANNIANINTPAFKRSDVQFSEVMAARHDPDNLPAGLTPQSSLASVSARTVLDITGQGELEPTGQSMHLAIDGVGFIELMGSQGRTVLWRGGALSVRNDGLLATADGIALLAAIDVPTGTADVRIDGNGAVFALNAAGDATEIGRIALANVDDPSRLERLDGGFYLMPEDAELTEVLADQQGAGRFVQGAIERSNVNINEEMVRLMIVQRAYAANAQVAQAADQLAALANNLRK